MPNSRFGLNDKPGASSRKSSCPPTTNWSGLELMPSRGPHHFTMGPEAVLRLCEEEEWCALDDFLVAASATPGSSATIAHNTMSLFSMVVGLLGLFER